VLHASPAGIIKQRCSSLRRVCRPVAGLQPTATYHRSLLEEHVVNFQLSCKKLRNVIPQSKCVWLIFDNINATLFNPLSSHSEHIFVHLSIGFSIGH